MAIAGLKRSTSPNTQQRPRWLPTLERELRSRVGWADGAVSPFSQAWPSRRGPGLKVPRIRST